MKKYILAVALLVIAGIAAVFLLFQLNASGSTSGTIQLFVDGEEVQIDGINVEFSFAMEDSRNGQLQNGRFGFNTSAYGLYAIKFSITPSVWGGGGQPIYFEVTYFNAYHRAGTEFSIQLNVVMANISTVEVVASAGNAFINSGEVLIESSDTIVSVHIPSP